MNTTIGFYRAVFRSMASRYAVYGINLLSLMWLSRLFEPAAFGVVAAVAVFTLFFQTLSEAGLGPAVINLESLPADKRDGIFGLTLLIGGVTAAFFTLLAPLLAYLYNNPAILPVAYCAAPALFFYVAAILPLAQLQRQQAFFLIASGGMAAEVISTSVAAGLKPLTDPVLALAVKAPVAALVTFASAYMFCADTDFGRPRPGRQFSAIKVLLSFSLYQFAFNFINFFARNLDKLLLGKGLGVLVLAHYERAYQLMRYPLTLLTTAMNPAIQPVIRQLNESPDEVARLHQHFVFRLSLLGALAGLAMYGLADVVVRILLGSQWQEVVPIIRLLSLIVPVQVVLSTSGSFFQGTNRPDLLFLSGLLSAVILVAGTIWGIAAGSVELLCWALVVGFHVNFVQAYWLLHQKVFRQGGLTFAIAMLPASIIVLFMITLELGGAGVWLSAQYRQIGVWQ